MSVPTVTLNNGVQIPQLGYGVFQVPPDETEKHVSTALAAGYRHIDTAKVYGNETGVGKAIASSGIAREELFVTTKLRGRDHGHDATIAACEASLERLGLDAADLYLIHWPLPSKDRYVETWQAMVELRDQGRVRAIGVSNFKPAHLDRLVAETGVTPAVNQIELHPLVARAESRAYDAEHGIVTESWRPLGKGTDLLDQPVVTEIARRHGRSPAQVVLRWHLQLGLVAIPKSGDAGRMAANLEATDLILPDEDMAALSALDRGEDAAVDSDTHHEE